MSKIRLQSIFNISNLTRNLAVLLRDLTFGDNFRSFTWSGTIKAGAEKRIRNTLTLRPNSYIIRYQTGDGLVTASGTDWTDDYVYMKNNGSNDVTVKITFWRE